LFISHTKAIPLQWADIKLWISVLEKHSFIRFEAGIKLQIPLQTNFMLFMNCVHINWKRRLLEWVFA